MKTGIRLLPPTAAWVVLVALSFLRAAEPDRQEPVDGESLGLSQAISTLAADEYFAELSWWAADEREGREPGTPGSIQAAERAAGEFRRLGLRPAGDVLDGEASYFQFLDGAGKSGLLPGSRLAVGEKTFDHEKDWSFVGGSPEASLVGIEVAFAGYGITAPEYGHDDYDGLDAAGKAILVLRYEPQEKDPGSRWKGTENTEHSFLRTKLQNAKKHGAVALLLVDGPLHHQPDSDPLMGLDSEPDRASGIPMAHVRKSVADAILAPAGKTLLEIQQRIDADGKPDSFAISGTRLDLVGKVGEISRARNVCALLEGSDPRLAEEVVIVGAHYDHVGRGAYGSRNRSFVGQVHNGADDNATGSVGVVELAEAFVEGGLRPRRSILFQLYDAEEKGLVGSRQYVERPAVPLSRTVAMINLDMIGHVKEGRASAIGAGTSVQWAEILDAALRDSPLVLQRGGGAGGGSDHSSFARKEIPVLFFHTGMDSGYHTPGDDAETCNAEGAVEVLKVVLKTVLLVADREERLQFQKPPVAPRGGRPLLGIQAEDAEGDRGGVRIAEVLGGAAAEKAGLRAGDIITAVDGKPVKDFGDLQRILGMRKPGDAVQVRYLRDGVAGEGEVEVVLGGEARRSARV